VAVFRVALCFPGQGSQTAHMADSLLELPAARRLLEIAAGDGLDLATALRGDDDESLRPTDIAQPALLLVEAVLAEELRGLEVVAVAGHSVGEYAALVAARALDAAAAMRLVIARGRAMAAMREGGMVALLGADIDAAEAICAAVRERGETLVVANLNGPGQIVLSGSRAAVDAAIAAAPDHGVRRAIPLRVSGAFHSPLMAAAAAAFGELLDAAPLTPPRVPVVCNVDGEAVSDVDGLRARLRRQLESPVRWSDCVVTLVGFGVDALVEVGPGAVLTGLARRIAPAQEAFATSSLDDAHAAGERVAAVAHG
jgi:[acyl-carrier-protein] S-malonyltransferase